MLLLRVRLAFEAIRQTRAQVQAPARSLFYAVHNIYMAYIVPFTPVSPSDDGVPKEH